MCGFHTLGSANERNHLTGDRHLQMRCSDEGKDGVIGTAISGLGLERQHWADNSQWKLLPVPRRPVRRQRHPRT
jgi:hypothetical protein